MNLALNLPKAALAAALSSVFLSGCTLDDDKNNNSAPSAKELALTILHINDHHSHCSGQLPQDTFLKEFSYSIGDISPLAEWSRSKL